MASETSKAKGNANDSGPETKCDWRNAKVEFGMSAAFDTRNSSFAIHHTTWKLARMNLAIRGISLSASTGERAGQPDLLQRSAQLLA